MSTALQGFRLTARSCTCREVADRYVTKPIGRRRAFSTTPFRYRRDTFAKARRVLGADPKAAFDNSHIPEPKAWNDIVKADMKEEIGELHRHQTPPDAPVRRKKFKQTFMNLGDPEPWEEEGGLEDDHDDMPSLAHGELEQHREMRYYARLAAWEMPLLATMAQPFRPPSADMPLRFRYTTYMGEQHPAEKKVVLEFSPADMPHLSPVQREKLKKLVGVRYNPEKDIVKMNCEMFETQAQNKRYLGDLVDDLLQEARTGDTFEDVPLDLRHHRVKPKPKYPKEWVMTDERRGELVRYRQQMALKDQEREIAGQLIDGIRKIEEGLAKPPPAIDALPEMAMAGKGAKGKTVSVRR